jgi:hypothetical protein
LPQAANNEIHLSVEDITTGGQDIVEWHEDDGTRLIIAQRTRCGWEFYERDQWEVRWFPMKPNQSLIDRANELFKRISEENRGEEAG